MENDRIANWMVNILKNYETIKNHQKSTFLKYEFIIKFIVKKIFSLRLGNKTRPNEKIRRQTFINRSIQDLEQIMIDITR